MRHKDQQRGQKYHFTVTDIKGDLEVANHVGTVTSFINFFRVFHPSDITRTFKNRKIKLL